MAFTEGFWLATGAGSAGSVANMNACLLGWGPKADFPAAATYKGRIAMATDEDNQLYYSDGATWVKLTRGKRALWVQPHYASGTSVVLSAQYGDYGVTTLVDLETNAVAVSLAVPSDFVTLVKAVAVVIPLGTGNMRWSVTTDFAANGEAYQANSDSIVATDTAVVTGVMTEINIADALTGLAANDYLGIEFTRSGAHANDTVTASVRFLGFLIVYETI